MNSSTESKHKVRGMPFSTVVRPPGCGASPSGHRNRSECRERRASDTGRSNGSVSEFQQKELFALAEGGLGRGAVLVCWGCHNRAPQLGSLNNRCFSVLRSGGWKFKIKMSAGLASSETSLLLLQMASFPCVCLCPNLFFGGYQSCWIRVNLCDFILI